MRATSSFFNSICLVLVVLALASCSRSKENLVEEFIAKRNAYDKEGAKKLLDDEFTTKDVRGNFTNRTSFLLMFDTLKLYEAKSKIISLESTDSVINTIESVETLEDSVFGIEPKLEWKKTYRFKADKILEMTTDSFLNKEKYIADKQLKLKAFRFWLYEKKGVEDRKDALKDLKNFLFEFVSLSEDQKNNYKKYADIIGTYISEDNLFYRKIIFKGKTTVVVEDALLGSHFPTSYVLDNNYIRIKTDKSDLLLFRNSSDTLTGEGFAAGTFVKVE